MKSMCNNKFFFFKQNYILTVLNLTLKWEYNFEEFFHAFVTELVRRAFRISE